MSYRELLIRQQEKNKVAKLAEQWDQERQNLQQDIINLQNSTDIKLLEQAQGELKNKTELLDNTIKVLGEEDIKNLSDLTNLLQGKTLKELATYKSLLEQKIQDQGTALINLARQKIKGQKDAEKLLNELETKWSKEKIEWEQEKENHAKTLAQSRGIIANLEKEKKKLEEQIENLNSWLKSKVNELAEGEEKLKQSHKDLEELKTNSQAEVKELKKQLADNLSVWNLKEETWKREKGELEEERKAVEKEVKELKATIKQRDLTIEHSSKNYEKLSNKEKKGQEIIKSLQKEKEEKQEIEYKLDDFLEWLEEDKERKLGKENWDEAIKDILQPPYAPPSYFRRYAELTGICSSNKEMQNRTDRALWNWIQTLNKRKQ
jgi:hypothetical protein